MSERDRQTDRQTDKQTTTQTLTQTKTETMTQNETEIEYMGKGLYFVHGDSYDLCMSPFSSLVCPSQRKTDNMDTEDCNILLLPSSFLWEDRHRAVLGPKEDR